MDQIEICVAPSDAGRMRGSSDASARNVIAVMERKFPITATWRGRYGARLDGEEIRLRFAGNLCGPFVLVLGGISAHRFVAHESGGRSGWWGRIARPGGPIDLKTYCVVGADYCPAEPAAPIDLCPEDFATLLNFALGRAGVKRLYGFVGSSFGGMIGLAYARLFPTTLDRLAVISAAHVSHPMAQAWRLVQRRVIEFAIEAGRSQDGVALARQFAMTTYRTPEEFKGRFDPRLGAPDNVGNYLDRRGFDYAAKMSAARYLTLSAAIDRHHEQPESITTPTLAIGVDSDRLVPFTDVKELSDRLGGPSSVVAIASLYGHDAFLKETAAIGRHLESFLEKGLP